MVESRLDTLRIVDPVLTNLALGYSPNYMIGNKIFPTIKVKSQKGRIPIFGRDSFVLRNSQRAIRNTSNRIPTMDFETIEFNLQERDLEIAMDYLEESETYDLLKYEQKLTTDLLNLLTLEKEKAIADYVQNPNNFTSDMKLELPSGTDFTSSEEIINIIKTGISAIRKNISQNPNLIVMGAETLNQLLQNSFILSKTPFTNNLGITLNLLKGILDFENIVIGVSTYSEDGRIFNDIWGNNIIIAYVDKSDETERSQYNPSYGYIFEKDGMPEIDSYYENGGKIKIIRATDNWAMKVVYPEAAYLIKTSAS
jgi:hypothetical protein